MRPYYYMGDARALTQLSTGEPFFVNTKDRGISVWIIMGGVWETFVDDVLCALVRPGDVFLDLGANMGYYTVKLGTRVGPTGKVYSFEPNPELFTFLSDNIEINGFAGRAQAFPVAAGAEAGRSLLNFHYANMGGGWVTPPAELLEDSAGTPVEVVRVDDVLPPDLKADLIKLDVEGFEPLALKGMTGVLARSPHAAIVTEVATAHWRRFGEPKDILREVAGDRLIFLIHHSGRLEHVPAEALGERLSPSFVSYVLLLPNRPDRLQQVRSFRR